MKYLILRGSGWPPFIGGVLKASNTTLWWVPDNGSNQLKMLLMAFHSGEIPFLETAREMKIGLRKFNQSKITLFNWVKQILPKQFLGRLIWRFVKYFLRVWEIRIQQYYFYFMKIYFDMSEFPFIFLEQAIEEFLSKDISFVVTNRKDVDTRCSPRSNSTPSPILSVPSPFPGNTKR